MVLLFIKKRNYAECALWELQYIAIATVVYYFSQLDGLNPT